METAILSLCVDHYITAQELAEILQRSVVTIKNHYIARLVAQGKMRPRFPEQPTHPAQAYCAKAMQSNVNVIADAVYKRLRDSGVDK